MMDINKMEVKDLKALAYDLITTVEQAKAQLQQIQRVVFQKGLIPTSPEPTKKKEKNHNTKI